MYRKFRFTLRFLLGNLHDYDPTLHEIGFDSLPFTDRYMLHRLGRLLQDARASYSSFQFFRTYQVLCCSPPSQHSSFSLFLDSRPYPATITMHANVTILQRNSALPEMLVDRLYELLTSKFAILKKENSLDMSIPLCSEVVEA